MIRRILISACVFAAVACMPAAAGADTFPGIKTVTIPGSSDYKVAYDGAEIFWVKTVKGTSLPDEGDDDYSDLSDQALLRTSVLDGSTIELYRTHAADRERILDLHAGGGYVAFTVGVDVEAYDGDYEFDYLRDAQATRIIRMDRHGGGMTVIASGAMVPEPDTTAKATANTPQPPVVVPVPTPDFFTTPYGKPRTKLSDCGTYEELSDVTATGEVVYGELTREREAPQCGSAPNRNNWRYVRVGLDGEVRELFTSATKIHRRTYKIGRKKYVAPCNCISTGSKSIEVAGDFALVSDYLKYELLNLATGMKITPFKRTSDDEFSAPIDTNLGPTGAIVRKNLIGDGKGARDRKLNVASSSPILYPFADQPLKPVKLAKRSKPQFCGGRLISLIRNKSNLLRLSELDPTTGGTIRVMGVLPFKKGVSTPWCSNDYLFIQIPNETYPESRKHRMYAVPLG